MFTVKGRDCAIVRGVSARMGWENMVSVGVPYAYLVCKGRRTDQVNAD